MLPQPKSLGLGQRNMTGGRSMALKGCGAGRRTCHPDHLIACNRLHVRSSSGSGGPQVVENTAVKVETSTPTSSHSDKSSDKSSKEKGNGDHSGSSDEDSDNEMAVLLSADPVTVTVVEAQLTALFAMVVAGVLGSWLKIDPWSYYIPDPDAAILALECTIPLALGTVLLASVPTGIMQQPNEEQRRLMSTAEDDVISTVQVFDLGYTFFPAAAPAQPAEAAVAPATSQPWNSGLRLFQLFLTKPWFPEFTAPQIAGITASAAMQLTASELLARGLAVTLLASWARDAVASADPSSLLFWGKLLRISSQDTYRWFGTWVMAGFSMYAVTRDADRMQQWARLVMYRLQHGEPDSEDDTTDPTDSPTVSTSSSFTPSNTDKQQQNGSGTAQPDGTHATQQHTASTSGQSGSTSAPMSESQGSEMQSRLSSTSDPDSGRQSSSASDTSGLQAGGVEDGGSISKGTAAPLGGLPFVTTGRERAPTPSITVVQGLGSIQVELSDGEDNLPPTSEDNVVWSLAMAMGSAQVVLLAVLFGSTGTLVAPLLARVLQEVVGNSLVRVHAKGGPATAGSAIWRSGEGRKSDRKDD